MVVKAKIKQRDHAKEPYAAFDALTLLFAEQGYERLSQVQRTFWLPFLYDSEVRNGGHLQYFHNRGTSLANEVVDALEVIGALQQEQLFLQALYKWKSRRREPITDLEQYSQTALQFEFDELDNAHYKCVPSIEQHLQRFLNDHFAEFVDLQ